MEWYTCQICIICRVYRRLKCEEDNVFSTVAEIVSIIFPLQKDTNWRRIVVEMNTKQHTHYYKVLIILNLKKKILNEP